MAGYSGTPLARKLGITSGSQVALLLAPGGFLAQLEPLPPGVTLRDDVSSAADVILLFAPNEEALTTALPHAVSALASDGGLWIAWPKRAARILDAPSEQAVREAGLGAGLVDNKVCALDDTWSALRFVVRLADRPRWPAR